MQNSLLNFYYIRWMEINYIKPNSLSFVGRFFNPEGRLFKRRIYSKKYGI